MSFTERAGLFPVLLLTGCSTPVVVTGPPSSSVVDSYLSRSAADISAMQYRLYQSGPSAKRPVSVSSSKPSLSLPTHAPLTGASSSQPASQANNFINQSGAAPTLRAALRKIVPADRKVVFDKEVVADAPELWRWEGNDRWPFVVNKLLAERGLKVTYNDSARTITVAPAQQAQAGRAAPVKRVTPQAAMKLTPDKPVTAGNRGRNPFRGDAKYSDPGPVRGAQSSTVPPLPVIKPQPVPVRHWRVETGNTVKDWLYSQAAAEKCTVPGISHWTVAWATPVNYRVDAPLNFDGSFREMLNQLFTLYGTAKVPLYAGMRAAQCLVKVDDKEVQ